MCSQTHTHAIVFCALHPSPASVIVPNTILTILAHNICNASTKSFHHTLLYTLLYITELS